MMRLLLLGVTIVVAAAACGTGAGDDDPAGEEVRDATPSVTARDEPGSTAVEAATSDGEQRFPDVVAVELRRTGDTWQVAATLSSPYDGPDRYADAFRVLAPDGAVLGVRELTHDHANEQPFTRTLDVDIPDEVTAITVEGRDMEFGWGGETTTVDVPR